MSLLSLFKNSNPNNPQTLISGADDFLNNYLAHSYVAQSSFAQFEKVHLNCENQGLDELIAALTESSLFAEQKIIIVKQPFFLSSKTVKKYHQQLKKLNDILSHMAETDNVVVMIASYAKIDRRKKICKTILANFNVVQTNLRPYEVTATARAIIRNEGYQISNAALRLLVGRSDQMMDVILNNYQKLKMIAPQRAITSQMIQQNVDLSLNQNIFQILSAAFKGDFRQALPRLRDQLRQGTSPVQLLAVFENQIELLLVVKILAQRGRDQNQIVRELKVHPYRVQLALRSPLKIAELSSLLKSAIILDYHYKDGTYTKPHFLEAFLLSI